MSTVFSRLQTVFHSRGDLIHGGLVPLCVFHRTNRFHNVSDQQVFKVSSSHTTKTLPKPVGSCFLDNSSSHSCQTYLFSIFSCTSHETTVCHVTILLKITRFTYLTTTEQFCVSVDLYLYSLPEWRSCRV